MSVDLGAHEATTTRDCKRPLCTEPAESDFGPYAGLCTRHKEEEKERRAEERQAAREARERGEEPPAPAGPKANGGGDREALARRLQALARDADRKAETARKATEKALALKKDADEAADALRECARELVEL